VSAAATVTGQAISASSAAGALAGTGATLAGVGTVSSEVVGATGTGALACARAALAGIGTSSGVSTATGTGALASAHSALAGVAFGEIVVFPELPDTGEGLNHIEIYFSAVTGSLAVRRRWPPPAFVSEAPPARRTRKQVQLVLESSSGPDPYPTIPKTGKGVRSIPMQ
jgi:hypothetical protein